MVCAKLHIISHTHTKPTTQCNDNDLKYGRLSSQSTAVVTFRLPNNPTQQVVNNKFNTIRRGKNAQSSSHAQKTYVHRRGSRARSDERLSCGRAALRQENVHQLDNGTGNSRGCGASKPVPKVRRSGRPEEVECVPAVFDYVGNLCITREGVARVW